MSDTSNDGGNAKAKKRGAPPATGTPAEGKAFGEWYGRVIAQRGPAIGLEKALVALDEAVKKGVGDLPADIVLPRRATKEYREAAMTAFASAFSTATASDPEEPEQPPTEAELIEYEALKQGLDVESEKAKATEKLARLMRAVRMPVGPARDAEIEAAREAIGVAGKPTNAADSATASESAPTTTTATVTATASRPLSSDVGGIMPPQEPINGGGSNGGGELTALYDHVKARTGKFLRNSHDFLDDGIPFFSKVLVVDWDGATKGYVNFPVKLTPEGVKLMAGKPKWKLPRDDKREHVTALVKHFMEVQSNVNIRAVNAGVISQFKSLIMATMILPRMIAEGKAPKKGGTLEWANVPVHRDGDIVRPLEPNEITPSVLIKSLGGTNPALKAWRYASTPPREGEAEAKVPESDVKNRIAEAEKNIATAIERTWKDAAFERRDAATIAEIPAKSVDEHLVAHRAQPLGEMSSFVLIGIKVGDQLLVKEVRPLVIKLEREEDAA